MASSSATRDMYAAAKLMALPGIGPARANRIMRSLAGTTVGTVWDAMESIHLHPRIAELLNAEQLAEWQQIDDKLQSQVGQLLDMQAGLITILDEAYPPSLLSGLDNSAPPLLFYLGNASLLAKPGVGFCGSRDASKKGIGVARDCAEQLAENGVVVISGNARGVDQTAHHAALEAGGSTILVLPEGLLGFRVKKALEPVWDWDRVLVLSQFLPGAKWTVSNAMQRNKTIVGLSQVMILIEARETGGSIDAGRSALKMGRSLYAPVYEGMPETATGNRLLLEEGAKPLKKSRKTGRANLAMLFEELFAYML
ncbi:MAG: DNA-processing protein DprA [Chloroflexi bacterium]|nr:MAG: DNA-processing protein DprA [Chloroflexota bacterium]